jgi:hypothetical protein
LRGLHAARWEVTSLPSGPGGEDDDAGRRPGSGCRRDM